MINYYKCVKSQATVLGSIEINEFLSIVKNGNEYLETIKEARSKHLKDRTTYDKIKVSELPCYTLNFTFDKKKSNETIKASTGFIYLDYDNSTKIDTSNPLIFATWLSLSGTGRGVLVKTSDLTLDNFKDTYHYIAKELNIEPDSQACKATQFNVLSYDPNLYVNNESEVWVAGNSQINKKYQHSTIKIEKEIICTVMSSNNQKLRYNNFDEIIENIDFNGEANYDFKHKISVAVCYLPFRKIWDGQRNSILSSYAYQLRALNPFIERKDLFNILDFINKKKCETLYPLNELNTMIDSIMRVENLTPNLNATRRFFFNPDYDLSGKKRRQLSMNAINTGRTQKSIRRIEKIVNEWDFKKDGIITQEGIKAKGGGCLNTIIKYYPLFEEGINQLNNKLEEINTVNSIPNKK